MLCNAAGVQASVPEMDSIQNSKAVKSMHPPAEPDATSAGRPSHKPNQDPPQHAEPYLAGPPAAGGAADAASAGFRLGPRDGSSATAFTRTTWADFQK